MPEQPADLLHVLAQQARWPLLNGQLACATARTPSDFFPAAGKAMLIALFLSGIQRHPVNLG